MDHLDAGLEQRVWSRVRGEQPRDANFPEMLRLCRQQLSALKRVNPELYRQERQDYSLLTALQELLQGKREPAYSADRSGGGIHACRNRCARQLELYVAAEGCGDYGPVFTALARRKRAQYAILQQYSNKKM